MVTVVGNLPVIDRFAGDSPVLKLEYYLDKGGGATLVQPASGRFDRSCQEEGGKNRKVRAKNRKIRSAAYGTNGSRIRGI